MTTLNSVTTVAGHNKEAAKKALNLPVVFTDIALGDDDRYPTGGETELANEVYRGAISDQGTVPGVPNATYFDLTVPADVPTFLAREIGLLDEDGVLYALSRYDAPIPKFGPDSANQSAFTFRIIVLFSATANIVIEVDPGWKHTINAQLRPDFRSVNGFANDPPGAPLPGDTWIVGLAPTGAWAGRNNLLAEWSGTGWTFSVPTSWMHVGLPNRTDWRWDNSIAPSAWVEWKASETARGPVRLATEAEHLAGAPDLAAVPAHIRDMIAASGMQVLATHEYSRPDDQGSSSSSEVEAFAGIFNSAEGAIARVIVANVHHSAIATTPNVQIGSFIFLRRQIGAAASEILRDGPAAGWVDATGVAIYWWSTLVDVDTAAIASGTPVRVSLGHAPGNSAEEASYVNAASRIFVIELGSIYAD